MKPASPTSVQPRRGQTLIFMLMMMVILTFVAFSVYDTQHVVVQRVRTQIAADSAALTGARWQLACLNAIGEINLMKVTTEIVSSGLPPPFTGQYNYNQYQQLFSALDKLQAKIAITGPMMGVLYAEQAAKLNGMHAIPDYANTFLSFAQFVEQNAGNPNAFGGGWLQSPIFNTSNTADMQERQQLLLDYAALMREIANQGMPALPNFFPADYVNAMDWSQASPYAREYLPNPAFYAAIAGQDWCFLKPLLYIYSDWPFWGPVYPGQGIDPFLILSLQLIPQTDSFVGRSVQFGNVDTVTLGNLTGIVQSQLNGRGLTMNPNWPGGENWSLYGDYGDGSTMTNASQPLPRFDMPGVTLPGTPYVTLNWAMYGSGWNNQWNSGDVAVYLNSTVRDQYNYASMCADSVWWAKSAASVTMAVPNYNTTSWTAPGQSGQLNQDLNNLWDLRGSVAGLGLNGGIQAASYARAFGSIGNTPPTQCPMVLPVFTDVRLIPSIVSSGKNILDIAFVEHVMFHLPPYTQRGVYAGGCTYCSELKLWDNPAFRQIGLAWWAAQANNPNPCPVGGGGGGGGIMPH